MNPTVKFGVFDHLDASGLPLGDFYEHRLQLIEAYERIGIHCYHTAEHHATPLGMCPSPSVLHSAIAQRTKRILFGPLVYTLALYHPLRLAEEICMLDHMSGGRFQVGVGRGISPYELGYYGVDAAQSQAQYHESYAVVMQALSSDTLTHEGKHFTFRDVPIQMHPLQRPHPPLWYGVGNVDGVAWCVQNKVNAVVNGPLARVREITDRYRSEWAAAGNAADKMPLVGTTRHLVIAETDGKAMDIARRAYARWYASFMFLWKKHGTAPMFAAFPEDFDAVHKAGLAAVGSPETVRALLASEIKHSGVNYLLCRFAFGDLTLQESLRSVDLFAQHVMPHFADTQVA
ncbi:MAG: LLM class flavin-dependent oxidoreductase [Betaproteobacteria bacterium]|nr:LLM class flavin-dependent oxidoreductase [Betaproteobacteria bacterium]